MANAMDLSAFSDMFARKNLNDINELVAEKCVETSEMNQIATMYDEVVFNQDFGFIGEEGLIGSKGFATGENIAEDDYQVKVRRVTFTPQQWGCRLKVDYSALSNSAAVYAMKKGVRVADLTSTDVIDIIVEQVAKAVERFKWRMFFLNDKQAQVSTETATDNLLKAGNDAKYWNILDGFLKQMNDQATSNPVIKANKNARNEITNIEEVLSQMYYGANMALRGLDDQVIVCSQRFADAYAKKLSAMGELESMLKNTTDGIKRLTYNGVELFPVKILDELIAGYINKPDYSNFAFYTSKSILGVATDSLDSFKDFNIWYDNYRRTVYIDIAGKADCQLMNPNLFKLAL